MMIHQCIICNKEFNPIPNTTGKYCSLSCSNRGRNGIIRKTNENQYDTDPVLCKKCNTVISYDRHLTGATFCDASCAAVYNNALRGKRVNICKYIDCDNEFFANHKQQFCSMKCSGNNQHDETKKKFRLGLLSRRMTIKKIMLDETENKCYMTGCGISEWMNQPVPLELDHIDGDAGNNMPANLRLLCPNCHAQTSTAKGKNRGHGRTSRGISLG